MCAVLYVDGGWLCDVDDDAVHGDGTQPGVRLDIDAYLSSRRTIPATGGHLRAV